MTAVLFTCGGPLAMLACLAMTVGGFLMAAFAVGCTAIAAAAGISLWYFGNRVSTAKDTELAVFQAKARADIAAADRRAAEANEKAAVANERAAKLEIEASGQRERAAKAEKDLLELRKFMTPRKVSTSLEEAEAVLVF